MPTSRSALSAFLMPSPQANGRCRIAQVISSGFAEVEEGVTLELALIEKARAATRAGARPQHAWHLFAARRSYISAERTEGSRLSRHRGAVRRSVDRHHQARRMARAAVQRTGDDRQQRRRRAARACRLLSGRPADESDRPLSRGHQERPGVLRSAALAESHKASGHPQGWPLAAGAGWPPHHIPAHSPATSGPGRRCRSQLPVAMVSTVDKFLDALLALQFLTPRPAKPTNLVTLFGNGGGSSVLGSDAFARGGAQCICRSMLRHALCWKR